MSLSMRMGMELCQELRQMTVSELVLFSNILEMANNQLFDYLKSHEGTGETGAFPMFSLEKVMTIERHLDIWVESGMIREASTNYVRYPKDNGDGNGKKSHRSLSSIAWMLQVREKMLKVVTTFILRYHHEFFWGESKRIHPISIIGAVNYINGRLEEFSLDKPIEESMFSRLLKNKKISVEGKEYFMRFFFTSRKLHPHESRQLIERLLKGQPRLSDQALAERIQAEFGYNLARRTVAKYRKEIGIPSSFER